MKSKLVNRNTLLGWLLFLVSPVLAIPSLILGLFYKQKSILYLLFTCVAIISFLYIPLETNDKARYILLYEYFLEHASFECFIDYLIIRSRPDFLFHFFVYIFSYLSIPSGFLFFIITFITLYNICFLFNKILIDEQVYLLFVLVILVGISYPDLFSGIRFYLASSFIFPSLYYFRYNKKLKLWFSFVLAISIHFSSILLIFSCIIMFLFEKTSMRIVKNIFIFSLFFVFLPTSVYESLVSFISVFGSEYEQKGHQYLIGEDFLLRNLAVSGFSAYVKYYYSIVWILLAYVYCLFCKKNTTFFKYVLILFSLINIFYNAPTVFFRYMTFAKILFALYLIFDSIQTKSYKLIIVFFFVFFGSFTMDIIVLRDNLLTSLFTSDSFFLFNILWKDVNSFTFIK